MPKMTRIVLCTLGCNEFNSKKKRFSNSRFSKIGFTQKWQMSFPIWDKKFAFPREVKKKYTTVFVTDRNFR